MPHRYFPDIASFRAWLKNNHKTKSELIVAFHRVGSGKKSITYPEALDEALCFGWIDGVRKSLSPTAYTTRFTPRKPKSNWSIVNTRRVRVLIKLKRMTSHGLRVFQSRDERRTERYSYERKTSKLSRKQEKLFRANKLAWKFFQLQAPWYRRVTTWWVVSAVKPETRERRLAELIRDSAAGRRIHTLANNKES
ncbi:MAG: YdeI/OmpD-associated family protein [Acidobacteria bacterium]|nr:YdeI/OmpD-associated family protein [Acidobacteriota bacterium]MBS1866369.1 YdeI/OmpD-associated family protein [Acidobacteriota bacterium]